MAYTTTALVKTYAGISSTGDDTLIGTLVTRAQAVIDLFTQRTFESATATRRFTVGEDTDGSWLYFDADICSITTVTNKADATTTETISSTEYVTQPRNTTPYFAIKILDGANKYWDYATDPEMGVTVAGNWAYSTAAPNTIVQAATRLATYFYKQRDADVFDVTALPDAGVITVPQGIPADVKLMLAPYKRMVA